MFGLSLLHLQEVIPFFDMVSLDKADATIFPCRCNNKANNGYGHAVVYRLIIRASGGSNKKSSGTT